MIRLHLEESSFSETHLRKKQLIRLDNSCLKVQKLDPQFHG